MLLISPEYLQIGISDSMPAHMEGYKIPNSKILYGSTPKGSYLFQDLYCKNYHACFINLSALQEHKIVLLKNAPSFYIMVQLKNTLDCQFYKLANGLHHEWSINLFYSHGVYAEISLHRLQPSSTFILFIPQDIVKRLSKDYPLIKRFQELQNEEQTSKLIRGNPICNFKVMDLIHSIHSNEQIGSKTYVELIKATFELLSKKNLKKQNEVDAQVLQRIYAVREYTENHTTKNITRSEICEKFKLSMYHFEQTFSKIYNASPILLLRYYRMSEVKREVKKNNTGLKELAAIYHYKYNSFIRAFQSIYKQHPKYLHTKIRRKATSNNRFRTNR